VEIFRKKIIFFLSNVTEGIFEGRKERMEVNGSAANMT